MNKLIDCCLLRCQSLDSGEWLQYRQPMSVTISSTSGISVLDQNSSSVVLEFPIHKIQKVEFMTKGINRIFCGLENRDMAIKILSDADCQEFRRAMEICGIPILISSTANNSSIIDEQFRFPDLTNPEVHEFITDLLHTDGFQHFVTDLKRMIDGEGKL